MTTADAFRVTSELLALRRVYASLAHVVFLDEERAAVNACFRDRELWLVCALRELPPVLLAAVNARLACGAPPIRPPAADAPASASMDPLPAPTLTEDGPPGRVH
jgi:hypothetical protein